ncbi:MAG TPA: hypothetical protein VJH03_17750 [Blastocatellia bacterium]|nr:hypothetical protein [Blastocatellia bacterium]
MTVRLFVGNLPYDTTEADLRELFAAIGPLSYLHLATDRESGKPRGFAFVEFGDGAHAAEAVRRFNNQLFKGRPLAVNEARAKEDRPRTARIDSTSGPRFSTPPPARDGAARNFGPDAAPRRGRAKPVRRQQPNQPPKGPLRERVGGQFFGDDDDSSEDDLGGENFASRVSEPEGEGSD